MRIFSSIICWLAAGLLIAQSDTARHWEMPATRMRLVPHKLAYAHRDLSLIHCQNPQWINDTLLGNATLLSWDAEVQTPSGIDNWTFIAGEYTLS